jgi:hypothetical protein
MWHQVLLEKNNDDGDIGGDPKGHIGDDDNIDNDDSESKLKRD